MGAALIAPIALVALIAPGVSAGRSPLRAYDCSAPFAEGAYTLHWALERPQRCAAAADCPPSHIRLGVQLELRGQTATAAHARGWWVAFGISEAGGLRGVDMVRYDAPPAAAGARANGTTARLVDAHTRASAQMLPDAQQDWALERAPDVAYTPPSLGQGGLTRLVALVPMRRALRTSDRQFDRALAEDSRLPQLATNVVGQWGVGAYDGERAARERAPTLVARGARVLKPARGAAERGGEAAYVSAQLRLHRRQCDTPLEALRRETPGLRRVRVRMRERVIPPPEPSDRSGASAYTLECFDVADLLRDGTRAAVGAAGRVDETDAADDGGGGGALHALAFEARVWPPSNERHVHHISLQTRAAGCAERPPAAQPDAFLASWTPGMEPAVLPAGAGVRMGGPGAPRALVLVLHAEPRGGGALEPDSSGFIMYFVRAPASRARDAAVIEISATDGLMGAPLPIGSSRLRLSRPVVAPAAAHASTEPVTVFMAAAHMHALGVRARLTVRAANGSVVRVDSVDYYDPSATLAAAPRSTSGGFTLQPGDSLQYECDFQNDGDRCDSVRARAPPGAPCRTFGLGARHEMCNMFLGYYPEAAATRVCVPDESAARVSARLRRRLGVGARAPRAQANGAAAAAAASTRPARRLHPGGGMERGGHVGTIVATCHVDRFEVLREGVVHSHAQTASSPGVWGYAGGNDDEAHERLGSIGHDIWHSD